jgi:high-affinity iron transporter
MTLGDHASAALNIAVLVFREGLESILVLTAVTASFKGKETKFNRPVTAGVAVALVATLLTWSIAVRILDDIGKSLSALAVQAATELLAILVLLVAMNWFFHKLYWTGWISLHNQRKRELLGEEGKEKGEFRILFGMALLGFTSFYREGFEVVLFLQSYRLKLGGAVVLYGAILGALATGIVAILTFVAHRHLPYRKMLVSTGLMLAFVLLVMVGEEVREMQLARWLPVTEIPRLVHLSPPWMGFPRVCRGTMLSLLWMNLPVGRYLATIRIENEPGTMGPRATRPFERGGAPVGGGSNTAAISNMWFVLLSSVIVLALGIVVQVIRPRGR